MYAVLRAGHVIVGIERRSRRGRGVGVAAVGDHAGVLGRDEPRVDVGVLVDVAGRIAHEVTDGAGTTHSRSSGIGDAVGRTGDGGEGTGWLAASGRRELEGIDGDRIIEGGRYLEHLGAVLIGGVAVPVGVTIAALWVEPHCPDRRLKR